MVQTNKIKCMNCCILSLKFHTNKALKNETKGAFLGTFSWVMTPYIFLFLCYFTLLNSVIFTGIISSSDLFFCFCSSHTLNSFNITNQVKSSVLWITESIQIHNVKIWSNEPCTQQQQCFVLSPPGGSKRISCAVLQRLFLCEWPRSGRPVVLLRLALACVGAELVACYRANSSLPITTICVKTGGWNFTEVLHPPQGRPSLIT